MGADLLVSFCRTYLTVHASGYSGTSGVGSKLVVPADSLKNDFHVFAIEREEDEIR